MGMMTKLLTAGAVAAVMAGSASQAATIIDSEGVSGNPNCAAVGFGADTVGSIDVLSGGSFSVQFADADVGGNLCFNMNNSSLTNAVVTLAVATVNQGLAFWGFTGGVQLVSEQLGELWDVEQGVFAANSFTFDIAAGDTVFFDWIYGDPYKTGFASPEINFKVIAVPAAVPVPAAGFLLIGALGGLVALRRRKTA